MKQLLGLNQALEVSTGIIYLNNENIMRSMNKSKNLGLRAEADLIKSTSKKEKFRKKS